MVTRDDFAFLLMSRALHNPGWNVHLRRTNEQSGRAGIASFSLGLPHLPRLPVQDFITHCWREPFHEFMDSLRHAYDVRVVKPHLFICAFSLFQGLLESFF